MILPVEDEFSDVLSKAQKGQGASTEDLAARSGVDENEVRSARRGEFDAAVAEALGKELGLNVPALLQLGKGEWRPNDIPEIEGFGMACSPFYDWQVNAFAVWDAKSRKAIAFDTGTTASPLIELLEGKGLELDTLILTHAHWDHFDGAPDLVKRWPEASVLLGEKDGKVSVPTQPMHEGVRLELGDIEVLGFDTPGHTEGGMSFLVKGLAREIAIVGDALFAGSMGGANVSYDDGLVSLRRILDLDVQTVLAPGHGPLTTVAEERKMNCFYVG
ncbi:MBL fold metallo-hydrolase [Pelagicoccus sp. SDUM812002]|uniref:MBL fold metallo-hydrolase n=1 Tax=Pelagicoccus sp. SDUM812002 TaxID=3041266 RepID=UPI00280CB4F4|nr:MBL fold metallo-hydrolase [Pelagicoccus sp. SDUM812002]MDQ8184499.1 MBL fold metallo-hydrolase [Pelagicoccus sp. SDUM812002]